MCQQCYVWSVLWTNPGAGCWQTLIRKNVFYIHQSKLWYVSHTWQNCCKQNSDQLDNVQFSIARIITGARKGTSHDWLNKETNWRTLSERGSLNCVWLIWNISTNQCPDELASILPATIVQAKAKLQKCRKFHFP